MDLSSLIFSLSLSCAIISPSVQSFCRLAFVCFLIIADDLIKVHKFKPTLKWRQSFENYLKTMPPYYYTVSRLGIIAYLYVWHRLINTLKLRSHFCVLPTVFEESSENHGRTKPVGWQHGIRPELQRGVVFEEAQSTGLLLNWCVFSCLFSYQRKSVINVCSKEVHCDSCL